MEQQSAFERRTWFWLVVAGVLAVAAAVFHVLAVKQGYPLHHNQWHHSEFIIELAFVAVFVLLSGIALYALIHSRKHGDLRFKDVFGRTFHSGWVYYILFVLFMIVVANVWCNMCNQVFGDSFSFKGSRWDDIKSSVLWAPVREETQYRVLPFVIAVIPLTMLKSKLWRTALGCVFALLIFSVQMQFGYAHISPLSALMGDTVKPHLYIQGGAGVVYAITFGMVFYYAAKEIFRRQRLPNKCKAVLCALPMAFLASCLVHASYNLYWILSRTF